MKLKHISQIPFFWVSLFSLYLVFGFLGLWACGGATEDVTEDMVDENTVDIQLELNDNPLVPLAAKAEITTKKESKIKVTVMGRLPVETNFNSFSRSHQIPIVGLYPDQENKIQIEITDRKGGVSRQDRTIQTLPIPDSASIPKIRITENNLTKNDHRFLFVGGPGGDYVIDHDGNVRWYLTDPSYTLFTQLRNGNMIIGKGLHSSIPYFYKTIAEIDMLGNVIKEYEIANYAHHATIELLGGNLLVATSNEDDDEIPDGEDLVIEIRKTTGKTISSGEYDFKKILSDMRPKAIKPGPSREDDWAHINAISFNDKDRSLVFSFRQQSALINVTNDLYNNSRVVEWIIAEPNCWNLDGKDLTSKLLSPASVTTFPPSGQHSVRVLPNGNILVFDNGVNRGKTYPEADCSTSAGAGSNTMNPNKMLEYSIDKIAKTYSLVWQYELDENHRSPILGSVRQLASGNRLAYFPAFNPTGARPTIVEINRSKDIILKIETGGGVTDIFHSFLINFDTD